MACDDRQPKGKTITRPRKLGILLTIAMPLALAWAFWPRSELVNFKSEPIEIKGKRYYVAGKLPASWQPVMSDSVLGNISIKPARRLTYSARKETLDRLSTAICERFRAAKGNN